MIIKKKYILLPVVFVVLLLAACNNDTRKRRIPDLRETFSNKDKKPFGAYIAYHQLEEMFNSNTIRNEKKSFEDSWENLEGKGNVYVCIARSLYSSDADVTRIIDFVKNGNDIFFSASQYDTNLTGPLEIKISDSTSLFDFTGKPYKYTGLKVKYPGLKDTDSYQYFYHPFNKYFSNFNKTNTRVLGINENGDPNFIVIFKGKGRIFLHCEPRAFSNYFLLQKNNYQYLQKVFGFLKPDPGHFYWNEYYSTGHSDHNKDNGFSSLDEILSHAPLAMAFWLAIILLLLYILFSSKRKQRIIKVVKPNENTTVTFTETIGRLYLQRKDNKNIADKMITYFNEYIRNNYFLNTNNINDDFITSLSRKSGIPREKIESLYRAISHAHANGNVDDYQLLSLNEQIQNFYKTIN